MKYKCILILLTAINSLIVFQLPAKNILSFNTSTGHIIKVIKGQILYDNRLIFKIKYADAILYDNQQNRLIEDHGFIFLFIAMDGSPNLNHTNAFLIKPAKATLLVDAILSPVKDYDGDGYLEFGGSDLTEAYPNPDSMYYIPTAYYEIRNGKIHSDKRLIQKEDIKLNGLYLPTNKQLNEDGNCCKVIRTPAKKHKAKTQKHLIIK